MRSGLPPGPRCGVCAVLVEDNVINQEVAAAILRSAGVLVELANNGQDAVAKVRERCRRTPRPGPQDRMPGMDGLQTSRQIRANPACANLPIVAITADVVGTAREECLRAGMNGFVSKPFSPQSLFPVVARWAAAGETRPVPETKSPPVPAQPEDGVLPATLPGIDIEDGLASAADDRSLYRWLLRNFPEKFAAADQRIGSLLAEGKRDDAIREAHTIKGLAGSATPVPGCSSTRNRRSVRVPTGRSPAMPRLAGSGDQQAGRVLARRSPYPVSRSGQAAVPPPVDNEKVDHALP